MRRVHAFEFEDLAWFPAFLRNMMTEYLRTVAGIGGGFARYAAGRIGPVLDPSAPAIVDLCSGSGGVLPETAAELASSGVPVRATLTDLYPNAGSLETLREAAPDRISVAREPVDARRVPESLPGVRTLFLGLHHFRPADAQAILADAARARAPIAVFEGTPRTLPTVLLFAVTVPIMVLLMTPLVRPFRWSRLLFTYAIPLLPFLIWWDGIVSHLRTYTPEELRAMTADLGGEDYRWDVRSERMEGTPMTCISLVGAPERAAG